MMRSSSLRSTCLMASALCSLTLVASACSDAPSDQAPPPRPVIAVDRPSFDGQKAFGFVVRQVDFGPRVPGTPGHAAQLEWMLARLDSLADSVWTQSFEHRHSETGQMLALTNVIARFSPEAQRRIVLLAHWDTRPTSDMAAGPERDTPVPGANDGASGTAVLLQLAEHLAQQPTELGVDLLFVDGEDFGPTTDDMFLGARHYAARYAAGDLPSPLPDYGVLLDMVGDADPRFPIEEYSAGFAPDLAQRVWGIASRLGYGTTFVREIGPAINDDHVPLNEAGLATIDIIDFDYGPGNAYWHTPDDTPDQVRPGTLRMVGEVMLELIHTGG